MIIPSHSTEYYGQELSLAPAFLNQVMVRLRRDRPQSNQHTSYVRFDRAMGSTLAQLWFLTRGCTWDRRGSCTMCNYGVATTVEPDQMVRYVNEALDSIDREVGELYVSPSGSLLDPTEVPLSALRGILASVARVPIERFSFETRPETISCDAVSEVLTALPGVQVAAGFGLESADPWVLTYCLNKPGSSTRFPSAAERLHQRSVGVYANIALGAPFLTPAEAVDDALHSLEWSLAHGADQALLFPLHVKPNTLLEWLYSRGMYQPPSLWSLVEVLRRLRSRSLSKVSISWYRGDYGEDPMILASPGTCAECDQTVLALLDDFRFAPSEHTVNALLSVDCECRHRWKRSLESEPAQCPSARVISAYQQMAAELGLSRWWAEYGDSLSGELLDSAYTTVPTRQRGAGH